MIRIRQQLLNELKNYLQLSLVKSNAVIRVGIKNGAAK